MFETCPLDCGSLQKIEPSGLSEGAPRPILPAPTLFSFPEINALKNIEVEINYIPGNTLPVTLAKRFSGLRALHSNTLEKFVFSGTFILFVKFLKTGLVSEKTNHKYLTRNKSTNMKGKRPQGRTANYRIEKRNEFYM